MLLRNAAGLDLRWRCKFRINCGCKNDIEVADAREYQTDSFICMYWSCRFTVQGIIAGGVEDSALKGKVKLHVEKKKDQAKNTKELFPKLLILALCWDTP